MSRKFHFWMMILNALFVGTNAYFMTILQDSTNNALAAFVCLAGFCIALNNYINSES